MINLVSEKVNSPSFLDPQTTDHATSVSDKIATCTCAWFHGTCELVRNSSRLSGSRWKPPQHHFSSLCMYVLLYSVRHLACYIDLLRVSAAATCGWVGNSSSSTVITSSASCRRGGRHPKIGEIPKWVPTSNICIMGWNSILNDMNTSEVFFSSRADYIHVVNSLSWLPPVLLFYIPIPTKISKHQAYERIRLNIPITSCFMISLCL